MAHISYQPTDGLTYDPNDPKYWDEEALQKEVTRAFEICHGCRMCFKYCDSFPSLFEYIDTTHDGDVRLLTVKETTHVMDECFQCKLCEVQCPYTPRDGHEFMLDLPKLIHRWKAVRTKKRGLSLKDKVLSDPDGSAKMARMSLGVANKMNRVKMHRFFMEKALGIHRDKQLPDFAASTFESWAKKTDKIKPPSKEHEAVLFQTCYVQNNEPQIGKDTLEVMAHNQIKVACAKGLECCGMPAWERGDLDTLRQHAKVNLDILEPYVDQGAKVIGINPTCSMMLRREYPELVATEDKARAEKIAAAVVDPSEYLWSIRKEDRFNTEFRSTPGVEVAYHAPCHLRAQAVGFRAKELIKKGFKTQVKTVMECCGHDGTYAMTVEGFEPSQRIGKKAFDGMKAATKAEIWVTDCPLAAIQFEQHAGVRPMHPMTALARGYRDDGFKDITPATGEDKGEE